MKEQRNWTQGSLYLTDVTVDTFMMFPVSRNGRHEGLQLRRRLRHLLWGGVDGTPKRTGERTSPRRSTKHSRAAAGRAPDLMFSGLNKCFLILSRVRMTWFRSDISATLFVNFTWWF